MPEGASTASLTPTGILAYVEKYAEVVTGADVSWLTPDNITAMVAAYDELATGADISTLKRMRSPPTSRSISRRMALTPAA